MAATLVSYWNDSDNETKSHVNPEKVDPDALAHLQPLKSGKTMSLSVLNSAPEVAVKEAVETGVHLDPSLKEVTYNPTYETMFAPEFGPVNPYKSKQMAAPRNIFDTVRHQRNLGKSALDHIPCCFGSMSERVCLRIDCV